MDTLSNDKIDLSTQELLNIISTSTLKLLSSLEPHKKTTLRDVIDKVIAETKVQSSIANGLVPMIIHAWAREGNGTVEKGRSGGVFRLGKIPRKDPRPRCETCHQVIRPKSNTATTLVDFGSAVKSITED